MNILVIAAHPDDEVLGCGGTMARWASEGHRIRVLLAADGESARFSDSAGGASEELRERRAGMASAAARILGCERADLLGLPDNRLDRLELLDVVQRFEAAIDEFRPDTVLTHHAGDVNIDHQIVHHAVIAATRPQPGRSVTKLLFFEIASSTEWRPPGSAMPFLPNVFVDISKTMSTKVAALDAYREEMRPFPHPRSLDAVEALAKWRGASAGLAAAEAFMLGREITQYAAPA